MSPSDQIIRSHLFGTFVAHGHLVDHFYGVALDRDVDLAVTSGLDAVSATGRAVSGTSISSSALA
jgi:hypothetical protein